MFREAAPIGHLDVQLVYYRGTECRASKWVSSGEHLAQSMNKIECVGGFTQIGRVLAHALRENEKAAVQALVFIGDAFEGEGNIGCSDRLETVADLASKCGMVGLPIFVFQEMHADRFSARGDAAARKVFRLLALKSGGAYFEFNPGTSRAVEQLSERLNAIARLAVGDVEALQRIGVTAALTDQRS
jgi:hypothetical protein